MSCSSYTHKRTQVGCATWQATRDKVGDFSLWKRNENLKEKGHALVARIQRTKMKESRKQRQSGKTVVIQKKQKWVIMRI